MTDQPLPDPELNVQGEDPVIPDEGVDAVPPDLVAAGTDTDSDRPVDETLVEPLEGGLPDDREGVEPGGFAPGDADDRPSGSDDLDDPDNPIVR
jgi:hypothetical protein